MLQLASEAQPRCQRQLAGLASGEVKLGGPFGKQPRATRIRTTGLGIPVAGRRDMALHRRVTVECGTCAASASEASTQATTASESAEQEYGC